MHNVSQVFKATVFTIEPLFAHPPSSQSARGVFALKKHIEFSN